LLIDVVIGDSFAALVVVLRLDDANSPRTSRPSFFASIFRSADTPANAPPIVLIRVLGFGGSSSRMIRRTSSIAARPSRPLSNGVVPVSNSYNSTPSEYTSLRVSTSRPLPACSGDMYRGVPTICANCVNSVASVSACPAALATPKSITFGTGTPSASVTSTFPGFRSR
jgi:hypothetical protein